MTRHPNSKLDDPKDLMPSGIKVLFELPRIIAETALDKRRDDSLVKAYQLFLLAINSVNELNNLAIKKPQLARELASSVSSWPFLIHGRPGELKSIPNKLRDLGVGTRTAIKSSIRGRPSTHSTVLSQYYMGKIFQIRICERLATNFTGPWETEELDYPEDIRSEIGHMPVLSQKTREKWFSLIWKLIMHDYNGHPERVPPDGSSLHNLRSLGKHRGRHSVYEGYQEKLTPATKEANIRDGIKNRLKQSFYLSVRSD